MNLADRGRESENNLRNGEVPAGMQDGRNFLRGEEFRTDGDLQRAWRNARKGELAIVAGLDFLFGSLILARENYVRAADCSPGRINHDAANVSRQSRVGLLIRLLA